MNHPPTTAAEGLRMEVEKRVHIAMIHAKNTSEQVFTPMLVDTVNIIMGAIQLETAKAVQEAKMQTAADVITQFKQNRINHTLGTPVAEWERELETADKTLFNYLQQLQKGSE
jgi:hypothetical protein